MGERTLSLLDDRFVAEVKRVCHAGLDGPDLLRRTAAVLRHAVSCEAVFGSTIDPASNLMTWAVAERPVGDDDWVREAVNHYIDRLYFPDVNPQTVAMLRERQVATPP